MKKYLLLLSIVVIALGACKKQEEYDPAKQNAIDETKILAYLKANNITAEKDPASGLYFKIINPGSGKALGATITVDYVGKRLEDGSIFAQNPEYRLSLSEQVLAWQLGVPKISVGGEILLYSPSIIAYGNNHITLTAPGRTDFIEPNTVVMYDIKVISSF